jgi:hypothetical protein
VAHQMRMSPHRVPPSSFWCGPTQGISRIAGGDAVDAGGGGRDVVQEGEGERMRCPGAGRGRGPYTWHLRWPIFMSPALLGAQPPL